MKKHFAVGTFLCGAKWNLDNVGYVYPDDTDINCIKCLKIANQKYNEGFFPNNIIVLALKRLEYQKAFGKIIK